MVQRSLSLPHSGARRNPPRSARTATDGATLAITLAAAPLEGHSAISRAPLRIPAPVLALVREILDQSLGPRPGQSATEAGTNHPATPGHGDH